MKTVQADAPISDFMTATPHSIGQEQSLKRAHEMLREFGIRHLPVLHGGQVVGILSDRDLALVEALPGANPAEIEVQEGMSQAPYTVGLDTPLAEVAKAMATQRIGTAVVVDKGHLVGLFTTTDALRVLAAQLAG